MPWRSRTKGKIMKNTENGKWEHPSTTVRGREPHRFILLCCLHWRCPHCQWEKAALWRYMCPQPHCCGFWLTLLDLKPMAFCASSLCQSWSVEANFDESAWPKEALRMEFFTATTSPCSTTKGVPRSHARRRQLRQLTTLSTTTDEISCLSFQVYAWGSDEQTFRTRPDPQTSG